MSKRVRVHKPGIFWRQVEKTSACWRWTGPLDRYGYGYYSNNSAHRVAWILTRGPIPADLTVDHSCFEPTCVNPDHLQLLTNAENAARQRSALQSHCKSGHEMTVANTYWMPKGTRDCRACIRERQRRCKARRLAS